MSTFVAYVHEKYPEINLEVVPYSGANTSAYWDAQLAADEMPDIYIKTTYVPGYEDLSDRLVDLSGYAFTGNYIEPQIHNVTVDGAVYLLPLYYVCFGITYNKTLLEENGWALPNSFAELKTLAPKVEAAGYDLALADIALPGLGFQYLFNILDTNFLNTVEGRLWKNDYLSGTENATGSAAFMQALSALDAWRDVGMLNDNGDPTSDDATRQKMAEGNTLFLLGSNTDFSKDETTDEFGMMPYLSEDGSENVYILNTQSYVGLNKHLQDEGNAQKLEDALHVLELLATVEGLEAFSPRNAATSLLPLKEYSVAADSPYKEIEEALNDGVTAPFVYAGWENTVVPIGNEVFAYMRGESTTADIAACFDESQSLLKDSAAITTVTETLSTAACAKLVGIAFAKAANADLALISENKWYPLPDNADLNREGVSGELFALPVTDMELCSILPTGWTGTVQTVTLTGKEISDLAKTGYDRTGDGNTYPYALVTPENFTLEDDKTYTVAICGVTDDVAAKGNLTDTGIIGMDAARTYLSQFETLSEKDIIWE